MAAAEGPAAAQAGLMAAPQPPEPPDDGTPWQTTGLSAPPWVLRALRELGETSSLDPLVAKLRQVAQGLTRSDEAHDLLTGAWLGHAAHPLMTDLPLGAWLNASMLDLFGGRRSRRAATGLLAFGVVTALPTTATGLAELLRTDRRASRVAAVHASVNACALALYASSLAARRRHHWRGVCLALAGGAVATVGGYLGGHLAFSLGAGTERGTTQGTNGRW